MAHLKRIVLVVIYNTFNTGLMIFGLIILTGVTFTVTGLGTATLRALGTAFITDATGFSVTGFVAGASTVFTGPGIVSGNIFWMNATRSRLRRQVGFPSLAFAKKESWQRRIIPVKTIKIFTLFIYIFYKQVLHIPCKTCFRCCYQSLIPTAVFVCALTFTGAGFAFTAVTTFVLVPAAASPDC
jgi:hypothetical protein